MAVIHRLSPSLALLLAGCQTSQSALHPGGLNARLVEQLTLTLTIGGAVIFVFVVGLLIWALLARRPLPLRHNSFIVLGGLVFPIVFLVPLLIYSVSIGGRLDARASSDALVIEVEGHMWWWRVNYRTTDRPDEPIASANEIRLPVGREVELHLTSADVIHSFWAPNIAGKLDMIPGRTNVLRVDLEEPGVWRGQCAEFCGLQHTLMAFAVVGMPAEEFDAWIEQERGPARPAAGEELYRGSQAFVEWGCDACHTVRGTGADGMLGPDLTHVGSRMTIAAGTLANDPGTLAAWISASQHIKEGNRMPSYGMIDGPTLRALAAWLESLK